MRSLIIIAVFMVFFNVNPILSKEIDLFTDLNEYDAVVQDFYKNYNSDKVGLLYQKLLSRTGKKLSEEVVLNNVRERKKNLGKLIKTKFLSSYHASPDLHYLFYQANYEHSTAVEFFCLTHDSLTGELKITVDQIDTVNQMRNEGEVDERVSQAKMKIDEFRKLYNRGQYEGFYQRVDFGSENYTLPKDKFVSIMTEQKESLGRYVNAKLLFSRSKNNGVILTYLSQYEKYAVVELWGFVRDSTADEFKLRVYEFY
ncbi:MULTISPECIES: hypothetical protein [Enterobacterales]|uniref:hypothetical protein n=1 Tax=Enterobacterales TaxID=91347 RepID=UPI002EDB8F3B